MVCERVTSPLRHANALSLGEGWEGATHELAEITCFTMCLVPWAFESAARLLRADHFYLHISLHRYTHSVACQRTGIHAHTSIPSYAYICISIQLCAHLYITVHIYTCLYIPSRARTRTHIRACTSAYMHACEYARMHIDAMTESARASELGPHNRIASFDSVLLFCAPAHALAELTMVCAGV